MNSHRLGPARREVKLRLSLIAGIRLLEHLGPSLGRPAVDTLSGSKHANMKELRFRADGGVWRIAFAFAPERAAILLVGGDKSGGCCQFNANLSPLGAAMAVGARSSW